MEPRFGKRARIVIGLLAVVVAIVIFNYTRTLGTHGWVGAVTATLVAMWMVRWSRGDHFKLTDVWSIAAAYVVVGLMENYLAGNKAANDLSILIMAMIFGASQAYLIARWWLRKTGRTSLP